MNEQRRKQMIIAGALVAVVALVLIFLVFRRRGGEEAVGTAEPGATAQTPAGAAVPTAPTVPTATSAVPGAAGAIPTAGRPAGMTPTAAAAGAGGGDMGSPLNPPKDAKQPPFQARSDPFKSFPLPKEWLEAIARAEKAAEPPPIYGWGVPAAQVKTAEVTMPAGEIEPGATIRVAGAQRMSGILFDGRVWAILETDDGQSHVVKPGDVMENGAKVAAVSRDSMVIAQAGQRQNVELKGKPAAAATSGVTSAVPGTGRPAGVTMGGATMRPPGPPGSGGEMEEL